MGNERVGGSVQSVSQTRVSDNSHSDERPAARLRAPPSRSFKPAFCAPENNHPFMSRYGPNLDEFPRMASNKLRFHRLSFAKPMPRPAEGPDLVTTHHACLAGDASSCGSSGLHVARASRPRRIRRQQPRLGAGLVARATLRSCAEVAKPSSFLTSGAEKLAPKACSRV